MPEESNKTIRIPVKGEEGKHTNHKIRTIVISEDEGIKALYCVTCKKVITYLFAKNKGWTMEKAKKWVSNHTEKLHKLNQIDVDQKDEFLKVVATMKDGSTVEYTPNSPSFILDKEIEARTMGLDDSSSSTYAWDDVNGEKARGEGQGQGGDRQGDGGTDICVCPKCKHEQAHERGIPCTETKCVKCGAMMVGKDSKTESVESLEVVKFDKQKQIVYGVFLWPEKADHDGDVISIEDIEKVAHDFLVDYRNIDEMHREPVIKADVIESFLAWEDGLNFHGKKLDKGAWAGAIKVHDRDVWDKIQSGEYKAFSVRIAGVREPLEEE